MPSVRTQVSQQACWSFAEEFRASEFCSGEVAKSEQSATAGEIEVGGTSSDGERPRTVLKYYWYQKLQILMFCLVLVRYESLILGLEIRRLFMRSITQRFRRPWYQRGL